MDDIAVIGIGLRFPGDASSPEELWKVLEKGESQWAEFPKDRLNIDGYYHPGGDRQGSVSPKVSVIPAGGPLLTPTGTDIFQGSPLSGRRHCGLRCAGESSRTYIVTNIRAPVC